MSATNIQLFLSIVGVGLSLAGHAETGVNLCVAALVIAALKEKKNDSQP